ncbi:trigger factor [Synechococcus sp. RSCCF101]|uniref:trigger factor n=1 Tax=Synechococcus sp. RSCCF101 TaxID=2511069 RepID=UPI001248B91B|nr:trigger factor [Synechococcus sp. RSCCF101]QEY32534.1 trigger factor [Synechococcus sp. RSCCF101]
MSAALKVSTQPRPGSRLEVAVEVPGARSSASYEQALQSLSKSVTLPGFRRGRVPRAVLVQQIGIQRIRASALEGLVDSIWRDAMAQESIEALGQPELREGFEALLERFEPGTDLTLVLELDVSPQPKLRSSRNLTAVAESVAYDPAKVDELIERSRRELATLVPVEDRAAAAGDVALVAFEGTYTDTEEPIQGGRSDAMEVELEEGRMIPGFVEGIIGLSPGDAATIQCRFPDDYPQEDSRGREARFELTLKELKSRELPELDDSFARSAADKESMAELREELETRLREEAERQSRSNRHEALLEALVSELEVELPETLVQQEIRALIEQTATQMAQQGMDVNKLFSRDLVRSLMESSRPEAEKRLRRALAIKALAESEDLAIAEAELESRIKEVRLELQQSRQSSGEIDEQRLRDAVQEDLLRTAVMDWLESNSTVREPEPDTAPEAGASDTEAPAAATTPSPAKRKATKPADAEG